VSRDATAGTSSRYAWYGLGLLLCVYFNSWIDRTILNLLVGPVRDTMGLSDSQVGFLMGPAFAIFYILAGLPLGWLADRMSRRWLIVVGQALWSLASVAFGLARAVTGLVAARIGVGVGEASLSPAAYSLITDMFPRRLLARAMSVYSVGIYIGGGLAFLAGGYLLEVVQGAATFELPLVGERHGWQVVFFLVAAPTVPLTALLLATFREPRRIDRDVDGGPVRQAVEVTTIEFLPYFREHLGALAGHSLSVGLLACAGYGATAWMPEFFIRMHGWARADVGKALGLNLMISGSLGMLVGGALGDRWARRGVADAKLRVVLLAALGWLVFGPMVPFVSTGGLALALWVPAIFFEAMPWGVAAAAIQEIVPNQTRGQTSALFLLVLNVLGLGLGPQIIPLMTDYVFRDEAKLYLSLFTVTTTARVAAVGLLVWTLPRYRRALADCGQFVSGLRERSEGAERVRE
jgi:MFS family permease